MIVVLPTEVNNVMNGSVTFTAAGVVIRLSRLVPFHSSILMTLGAAVLYTVVTAVVLELE